MPRCAACDARLSDRDMSRKSPVTGLYYDLCSKCFSTIKDEVESVENPQLEGSDIHYDEPDDNPLS